MPEFNLQEEVQSLADLDMYPIDHELDVENMSPSDVNHALDEAVEQVTQNTECITIPQVFDVYRSVLK